MHSNRDRIWETKGATDMSLIEFLEMLSNTDDDSKNLVEKLLELLPQQIESQA